MDVEKHQELFDSKVKTAKISAAIVGWSLSGIIALTLGLEGLIAYIGILFLAHFGYRWKYGHWL